MTTLLGAEAESVVERGAKDWDAPAIQKFVLHTLKVLCEADCTVGPAERIYFVNVHRPKSSPEWESNPEIVELWRGMRCTPPGQKSSTSRWL